MSSFEQFSISREEAVALAASGDWKKWSHRKRAVYQLRCEQLCMPFGEFQKSVQEVLGRPVWTHEFANPGAIWDELVRGKEAPTMEEIIAMIPADKVIVLEVPDDPR